MRSKALLTAAMTGMMANPVLAHTRKVAYSLIPLKELIKNNKERMRKAEEKRLRKQERNLKNAKLNGF